MVAAFERLVNLAMYLADIGEPAHTDRIRAAVEGYSADQDDAAFARMFERDKDDLRATGLNIVSDSEGNNWLDGASTFAEEIGLNSAEAATIQVVGSALLDDPSFPFTEELRLALAKIASVIEQPQRALLARTADEDPATQGATVTLLESAIRACKFTDFNYTNSHGEEKHHTVGFLGLFVRDGRWYGVGHDTNHDEARVYAVTRMSNVRVNAARPKTPDFASPADFDVTRFIGLPFQYGPDEFTATLRFAPSIGWRAPALTCQTGTLVADASGGATWTVSARNAERLARWVIEHGPGITVVSPETVIASLRDGLRTVRAAHGGDGG